MRKEVIIIGAGPAGLACGMQLCRAGTGAVILEKDEPGGLLRQAGLVENYPGFPEGIEAGRLISLMLAQAHTAGVRILREEAIECEFSDPLFKIRTGNGNYESRFLVVSSGTVPVKWTGCRIPPEAEDRVGYGVSELRDRNPGRIAVIGAGDAAFDYALQLEKAGHQVMVFFRTGKTKCLPLLMERAAGKERIQLLPCHLLTKMASAKANRNELALSFRSPSGPAGFKVDRLIFATGRIPSTGFLSGMNAEQKGRAEREGRLLYAGDVMNDKFRQSVIAAGDGIRAAMKIAHITDKSHGQHEGDQPNY